MRVTYQAIITSILLHLSLLLFVSVVLMDAQEPRVGVPTIETVQAYLHQEAQNELIRSQPKQIVESTEQVVTKRVQKEVIVLQKTPLKPKQTPNKLQARAQHTQREIHQNSKGLPTAALLALLHAAIQKHQHYPLAAQEMEREGMVSVQFTLLADGHIKALKMLQSSGTASLDQAALKAVEAAVPFQKIDQYLHEPKTFSIDVVFELS